ncbi:hypothetical protein H0H93_004124, partial [Arthromyces matolae]
MPWIIPVAYFYLLPHRSAFLDVASASETHDAPILSPPPLQYAPLPNAEVDVEEDIVVHVESKHKVSLSFGDKWRLVKPLLAKYMLPL